MKKSILIAAMIVCTAALIGQQDAMYTHYMFNTMAVNPAYSGSRDALTVTGLHRSQWVGFPGAPTTQSLTMHTPIAKDKVGLGLSVINDKVGPVANTSAYFDLAYRLPVSQKGVLAFGVKGGLNVLKANLTELELQDQDPEFEGNIRSTVQPNFGFGLYYHTDRFYTGLSAPGLLANEFKNESGITLTEYDQSRHYFFIMGAALPLTDYVDLKPTILVKATEAAPIQADLTAVLMFYNKYWIGLMGRSQDAAGLLLGMQFTNQLGAGYSFDWSFANSTAQYNSGSHEIMLRYDFIFQERGKVVSPRFF